MSDIIIKGMEMPKEGEWISVNISHDGKCFIQSWCGKEFNFAEKLTAVPVPPHGDLIDRDAIPWRNANHPTAGKWIDEAHIRIMPTIIPAEEGET